MVLVGVILALIGLTVAAFSTQRTVGLVLTVLGIVLLIVGLLTGTSLDI